MRLFVALELPEPVREALYRWAEGVMASEPGLRGVASEALHVTLCFLGWRAGPEVPSILGALEVARGLPARDLEVGQPVWLPRRRPRVLAVGISDLRGHLADIQTRLSQRLGQAVGYASEHRQFLAHVTVARVKQPAGLQVVALDPVPAVAFHGQTVVLYRSHLGGGPVRYETLQRIPLEESG